MAGAKARALAPLELANNYRISAGLPVLAGLMERPTFFNVIGGRIWQRGFTYHNGFEAGALERWERSAAPRSKASIGAAGARSAWGVG